jgi:hypothetical protein
METFLFERPEKKVESDITWYIVQLKKSYELKEIYSNSDIHETAMKELNSIRNIMMENLCQSDSLFAKKPSIQSLNTITPPFYTLPDRKWSPVVKWENVERPEQFNLVLKSVYISRSLITPFFVCTPHTSDVIELDLTSSIHPDLEEYDCLALESETLPLTLRNLKKERMMAKKQVKELFNKAYQMETRFYQMYGDLDDDESTFSNSDSESSSD